MKVWGIKKNFLAIEPEYSDIDRSTVAIQSFPYEHTSSYHKGSARGPEAIISASRFVELYDEELDWELYREVGICTLAPYNFRGKKDTEAMQFITQKTIELLKKNKFIVSLGAEHTVTYGIVRAFQQHLYPNFSILQIDAHSDLRASYQDNPWSHASVMARCRELDIPITQVGIRAQCIEESIICKEDPDVHTFYAHQIDEDEKWVKKVLKTLQPCVYITIDADGFDPSVIPSVGTPEPNGLNWKQVLRLLKKVAKEKQIIGFDVVEVLPRAEDTISEYTLAKLIYRLLGYIYKNKTDFSVSSSDSSSV